MTISEQVVAAPVGAAVKPGDLRERLTAPVVTIAGFVGLASQVMIIPAIAKIGENVQASATGTTWLILIGTIAAAGSMGTAPRLGDRLGYRRVLLALMALLAIGAGICAVTTSYTVAMFGLFLQGTGAAAIPVAMGLVRQHVTPERLSAATGTVSLGEGAAVGLGYVLGGLLAQEVSASAFFWVLAGAAVLSIALILAVVRDLPARSPGSIDLPGAVLLMAWLSLLMIALSNGQTWGWTSLGTLGCFAGFVVAAVLWVAVESRSASPLIDLELLAAPGVWRPSAMAILLGTALYTVVILVTTYAVLPSELGLGFDEDTLGAALLLLPQGIGVLIAAPLAGLLADRIGERPVGVLGALVMGAGLTLAAFDHSTETVVLFATGLAGIGFGLALSAMYGSAVKAARDTQAGVPTASITASIVIGSGVGGALITSILVSDLIPQTPVPAPGTFDTGFWIGAAACGLAALIAVTLPRHTADAKELV